MGPRKRLQAHITGVSKSSSPSSPSSDAGDSKASSSSSSSSSSASASPLEELKPDDSQYEKAELQFLKSIANTYPRLKFEVTGIARVKPAVSAPLLAKYEEIKKKIASTAGVSEEDVKDRWVFHTAGSPDIIPLICASTLRASGCAMCKAGVDFVDFSLILLGFCLFVCSLARRAAMLAGLAITRKECMSQNMRTTHSTINASQKFVEEKKVCVDLIILQLIGSVSRFVQAR